MFKKLAKVRSFELWLTMLQRGAVRLPLVACNDNRPDFIRPIGSRVRQSLAGRLTCRWSLSHNGRLECRWDLQADGQPRDSEDPSAAGAARLNPLNALEFVAGERARDGRFVPPATGRIKNKQSQCR